MRRITQEEIDEALDVAGEIYADTITRLTKKYPALDTRVLAYTLWYDLGQYLIQHHGFAIKDFVEAFKNEPPLEALKQAGRPDVRDALYQRLLMSLLNSKDKKDN